MDYESFCKILTGELSELPINRKERFYTGTVLPSLLFHNGLSNFYNFLEKINGFPREVNENATRDNFLFYTDYNLKESAGDRNVGRKIPTEKGYTPDIVIEILTPKKVFIIVEAKMFEKISQSKLNEQIIEQKKHVAEPLKKEFPLENNQIFHIALVPKALRIRDEKFYQVINWEFFIDNQELDVVNNYFYNYLKFALDNYKRLVEKKSGQANTVEGHMNGAEVYRRGVNGESFWVGRGRRKGKATRGRIEIEEEIKSNRWDREEYNINFTSLGPPTSNWISVKEFIELVDKYGKG
jgi:hypothetical protein